MGESSVGSSDHGHLGREHDERESCLGSPDGHFMGRQRRGITREAALEEEEAHRLRTCRRKVKEDKLKKSMGIRGRAPSVTSETNSDLRRADGTLWQWPLARMGSEEMRRVPSMGHSLETCGREKVTTVAAQGTRSRRNRIKSGRLQSEGHAPNRVKGARPTPGSLARQGGDGVRAEGIMDGLKLLVRRPDEPAASSVSGGLPCRVSGTLPFRETGDSKEGAP